MARFGVSKVSIWSLLLKLAAIMIQVHAKFSLAEFLSIDCGIASNFSYIDDVTNIAYVSEEGYINTGSSYVIGTDYNSSRLPLQLLNVRSFPIGDRNCYTLPVVQSHIYLVRARFMYGNYDGKNKPNASNPLQFDLHLGINLWQTINITSASYIYTSEALTITATNFLSVCLINTGNGDPFISALELRPLKENMYNMSQTNPLALVGRFNIGSSTDEIRYPEDPYDRLWEPWNSDMWTTLSTGLIVDNKDDFAKVPSVVLQTAAAPINGSTMEFYFDSDSKDEEFYVIICFTELTEKSTRSFDIYRNGNLRNENLRPGYLTSNYVFNTLPFSGYTRYEYLLKASNGSTLPPFMNALEIYSVIPATEVPTDLNDVHAMNGVREQYNVVKMNWMGDPCSPRQYIWDGLSCTYELLSARITKLNLSSSGLSGPISSSFANLTSLTSLDLSNNSLTGAIPDALGNLQSLEVLVLPCNYSSSPVPASLRQRSAERQVTLRFNDGAIACENSTVPSPPSSSTANKISKPVVVVLSMVLSVVLLIGT